MLLHSIHSAAQLEAYRRKPTQALLLTGPVGIGLRTTALKLAEDVGSLHTTVQPEKKTPRSLPAISVEQVRGLYDTMRVKMNSRQVIIIDDADAMSAAAQNALLKLLEEPLSSYYFILSSHTPERLLPTIRSRLQQINLSVISTIESNRLIKKLGISEPNDQKKLLFIASGLPAELSRLSQSKNDLSDAFARATLAKSFITGSTYDRMVIVQSHAQDREKVLQLIEAILFQLRKTIENQPHSDTVNFIDGLLRASEQIRTNRNIKLWFTEAVLSTSLSRAS